MGEYLTPLKAENLKGKWWRLTEPLIFCSEFGTIETPAGFVTDFASVPRVPLAYWLFGSRANRPATTHDDIYRSGRFPRSLADKIFREAMAADGYLMPTRWTMFSSVRLFGWLAYKATPGCLDPRNCPGRDKCPDCQYFSREYFDLAKGNRYERQNKISSFMCILTCCLVELHRATASVGQYLHQHHIYKGGPDGNRSLRLRSNTEGCVEPLSNRESE